MKFANKKVIITGAAQGIGKALAEAFKAEGATTLLIDINPITYQADFIYQGDLAEESILKDFSEKIITQYGQIDYLINNACYMNGGILSGCTYQDFLTIQKVGVAAPYYLTLLLKDHFAPGAAIVNMTSTRAHQSQPNTESYTAAKGGLSALTHSLAVSLAGKVRVNSIAPGWIDTTAGHFPTPDHQQHLAGRIGTPQDIINTTFFLCSKDSTFITGQNITLDGGMSKLMIYNGDNGWEYHSPKEVQKKLDQLIHQYQIQPVGIGYIDCITSRENIVEFIKEVSALKIPITHLTWWCHCKSSENGSNCPHGMGGPINQYGDGYFSEIQSDYIPFESNEEILPFLQNEFAKLPKCFVPGFWLKVPDEWRNSTPS